MNEVLRPRHEMTEVLVNVTAYAFFNTVKFRNKPRGLYFHRPFWRVLFLERLIFVGAYIRREVCVSKSAKLILGEKFASQNRSS